MIDIWVSWLFKNHCLFIDELAIWIYRPIALESDVEMIYLIISFPSDIPQELAIRGQGFYYLECV